MTALTLYQLSDQLQQVARQLAEDGLDDDTIRDTLESISGDFDAKATSIVSLGRSFESLAAQIKDAETQMARRRKTLENRVAHLKAYVLAEMQKAGIQKIDSPWFSISTAANPAAVDLFDSAQLPDEFWITPPPPERAPNKAAIKAALEAGQDVPGARLTRGTRLVVR
ncbi:MAG: siphovirus Gp157 family protein [Pseudomonadales bacterium]|nr:siphovirus Gp157 family protein [Pseudomonadales bacterium]